MPANKNPFRYRGYYYDADLGLYYLGSRYYDSNTGRFLNLDSIMSGINGSLHGFNLYVYCYNNPVNMSDHSGNWPKLIKDAVNWVKNTAKNIKKTAEILFTKDFASNVDDIIKSNVEADAGISIGFAVEYSNDTVSFELSERIDIVTVQLKDGELRTGHAGRSAFTLGLNETTIGPQNDTFEYFDGTKDNREDPTYYDVGKSYGKSSVFVIGFHYGLSISYLGIYDDVVEYVKNRW